MSITQSLSIEPGSDRAKILSNIDPKDFAWAVPIMRSGYAGRGLVYLVVAGLSLWSISRGGGAEGTQTTMESLSGGVGTVIVSLIAAGMFAYAIWRIIDAIWDLEAEGTSIKGLIARAGMVVTGVIHAGIGVIAITALGVRASSGGGKSLLSDVMQSPGGPVIIAVAGALTVGAGIYYIYKGVSQSYRDALQANKFTLHWNPVLQGGLIAQGISIGIIGSFILYAAFTVDASQVGGLGTVFEWLQSQSYGLILVIALCIGLLGFSLFCFVNAAYRIIPKAADGSVQNMTARLKESAA